jgi:hypothetical protein
MRLITTEAQRHREDEEGKDPRTSPIIGAAIEVHRNLGPGLLESAYEECLCHELHLRGIYFKRQVPLPLLYIRSKAGLRIQARPDRARRNHSGIEGSRKALANLRGPALDLPEIDWQESRPSDQLQRALVDTRHNQESSLRIPSFSLCLCGEKGQRESVPNHPER